MNDVELLQVFLTKEDIEKLTTLIKQLLILCNEIAHKNSDNALVVRIIRSELAMQFISNLIFHLTNTSNYEHIQLYEMLKGDCDSIAVR